MLSSSDNPVHPLLPVGLKKLISSRAPGEKLAASVLTIPQGLNGAEKEIADLWLTDEERTQLGHYTFAKRKEEWLSGRICAKQATIDLLKANGHSESFCARDFSISSNPSGRPFLNMDRLPFNSAGIDISISHSHDMAVGLAGHCRCGIDIQLLSETLFKVKHRFCADVETAILDQITADELVQLGLLWVAKEAVRKCFSETRVVGFRELKLSYAAENHGYYLLQFQTDLAGISLSSDTPLSVITHHDDSYAIAVCTAEKE
jgi:4'-phosphopantetheinyl transferase EntD